VKKQLTKRKRGRRKREEDMVTIEEDGEDVMEGIEFS
jgi:hypothetical protein